MGEHTNCNHGTVSVPQRVAGGELHTVMAAKHASRPAAEATDISDSSVDMQPSERKWLLDMEDELLASIAGYLVAADWRSFQSVSRAAKAVADGAYRAMLSSTLQQRLLNRKNAGKELCRRWPNVVVPAGISTINSYAFNYCEGLTSIILPEGVTTLGGHAFYRCFALASVTLPEGLTTIGEMAFWGCSALPSVMLPKSVTTIKHSAFSSCLALDEATRAAVGKINPKALL